MITCVSVGRHITLTASLLGEVLLHVVTVDLGPAEDDGLVHLVLVDGPDGVLALQHLDGLRPRLYEREEQWFKLW